MTDGERCGFVYLSNKPCHFPKESHPLWTHDFQPSQSARETAERPTSGLSQVDARESGERSTPSNSASKRADTPLLAFAPFFASRSSRDTGEPKP